jgi:2,4-dienoyl-CoA reductase-like NADH-dependent reductase (Old Yellow Enzyme family)
MIKINSEDFLQPGLTVDEMLEVVAMLRDRTLDAVELSGGTALSGPYIPVRKGRPDSPEEEAFYRAAARHCKQSVDIPVMLVGGIRSFDVAEQLLGDGTADLIALSRPLIREPGLVNRWKAGDTTRSECNSDNLCFRPTIKGDGVYCLSLQQEKKKAEKSGQDQ